MYILQKNLMLNVESELRLHSTYLYYMYSMDIYLYLIDLNSLDIHLYLFHMNSVNSVNSVNILNCIYLEIFPLLM